MIETNLSGGRGWLDAPAAASLERYERDHGEQPVTSAGRTEREQQSLIDRWDQGGVYNRPPYLYEPKRPASSGTHVSGNALDLSNYRDFAASSAAYGWWQPYSWDVVHFEYDANRDQHINDPAPGATISKEDSMPLYFESSTDPAKVVYALSDALATPAMRACGPGEAAIARAAGAVTKCDDGTLRMVAAEAGYDVKLRRTDVGARLSSAVWHGVQIDFGQGGKESPLQTLADTATAVKSKG